MYVYIPPPLWSHCHLFPSYPFNLIVRKGAWSQTPNMDSGFSLNRIQEVITSSFAQDNQQNFVYWLRTSETPQTCEVKDEVSQCSQLKRLFYFLGLRCAPVVLIVQTVTGPDCCVSWGLSTAVLLTLYWHQSVMYNAIHVLLFTYPPSA